MSERRDTRLATQLRKLAAAFLAENRSHRSLITVTGFELAADGKHGRVLVTIMPADAEGPALAFANRHLGDLQTYIRERLRVGYIPRLAFALDQGEKNRQKIDELLR